MSILINMKMPKDRPVRIDLYPNGKALLFTTASDWVTEHTVIELPPHGRLIDAERIKEVFHRNVASADAFDCIFDNAPTIIEAEVDDG